jgi:hypothetical protein
MRKVQILLPCTSVLCLFGIHYYREVRDVWGKGVSHNAQHTKSVKKTLLAMWIFHHLREEMRERMWCFHRVYMCVILCVRGHQVRAPAPLH